MLILLSIEEMNLYIRNMREKSINIILVFVLKIIKYFVVGMIVEHLLKI